MEVNGSLTPTIGIPGQKNANIQFEQELATVVVSEERPSTMLVTNDVLSRNTLTPIPFEHFQSRCTIVQQLAPAGQLQQLKVRTNRSEKELAIDIRRILPKLKEIVQA